LQHAGEIENKEECHMVDLSADGEYGSNIKMNVDCEVGSFEAG
jgi:hypothetical protein